MEIVPWFIVYRYTPPPSSSSSPPDSNREPQNCVSRESQQENCAYPRPQCPVHATGIPTRKLRLSPTPTRKLRLQGPSAGKIASAGNRTRVTSMATTYSTTRPLTRLQFDQDTVRENGEGFCPPRSAVRDLTPPTIRFPPPQSGRPRTHAPHDPVVRDLTPPTINPPINRSSAISRPPRSTRRSTGRPRSHAPHDLTPPTINEKFRSRCIAHSSLSFSPRTLPRYSKQDISVFDRSSPGSQPIHDNPSRLCVSCLR